MKFHDFFGIDFRIDFASFFDEKGSQNGGHKYPVHHEKSILFATLSFMLVLCWNLAHFGLPLATLWVIPLRSAHTRRPAYTLRQNPLRHLTFETPFPRFYRAQKTGGMNGACAPFGGRRARCARVRGGARCARAAWGGWARGALWGYSEAIPNGKPFRLESYYERKLTLK